LSKKTKSGEVNNFLGFRFQIFTTFLGASEATATWRFTNFVLYCKTKLSSELVAVFRQFVRSKINRPENNSVHLFYAVHNTASRREKRTAI